MKELSERGLSLPHAKALVEKLKSLRVDAPESPPPSGKLGKSIVGLGVGKQAVKLAVKKVNVTTMSGDSIKAALEELFQKHQR